MQSQQKLPAILDRHWLNLAIAILLLLLYLPLLFHWVDGWVNKSISTEHEYFSHGLIGIPYAAAIAWSNRKRWQRLSDRSHPVGVALLVIGAIFYISGTIELVNLSLPIVLAGICLWLKGVPGLKLNAFSLGLIFFATPNSIPYLITPFTIPLQAFIAGTAGFILNAINVPDIAVEGIYITVQDKLIEVAPYCAGLKMLFTSLYVGAMLLHWTGLWRSRKKIVFFAIGAIVISISVNIFRNTLLTYLHGMGFPGLFEWTHAGLGGDLISLGMLALVVVWLDIIERFNSYYKKDKIIGILDYGAILDLPQDLLALVTGGSRQTSRSQPPEETAKETESISESEPATPSAQERPETDEVDRRSDNSDE
ncbi:cyanoexosortase B [Spirulina sp. 06S082]|uniref:cyanoexosortase B n=1 Tax=Spirulina sp. 06S082 TaxID=3110248 RepID=UPI002B2106EB|nr:cyanoexosortase B [Spirulina sp. 06S082]MEA5469240.1 cyanoexosortase B [Spirulina sp. 06S082]